MTCHAASDTLRLSERKRPRQRLLSEAKGGEENRVLISFVVRSGLGVGVGSLN